MSYSKATKVECTGREVERQRGEDSLLIATTLVEQSKQRCDFETEDEMVLQVSSEE